MSWDLRLDTLDHDLVLRNGDILTVTEGDQTAQHLKIRLYTYLGEWFLNITIGTPYYEKILGQKTSALEQSNIIRRRILQTDGVDSIITLDFERVARQLSINGQVKLDNGDTVTISTTVI